MLFPKVGHFTKTIIPNKRSRRYADLINNLIEAYGHANIYPDDWKGAPKYDKGHYKFWDTIQRYSPKELIPLPLIRPGTNRIELTTVGIDPSLTWFRFLESYYIYAKDLYNLSHDDALAHITTLKDRYESVYNVVVSTEFPVGYIFSYHISTGPLYQITMGLVRPSPEYTRKS